MNYTGKICIALFMAAGLNFSADAQIIVNVRPTRPVVVRQQPQPGPDYIWVEEDWRVRDNRYDWAGGYWERQKPGATWVPGHWERRGNGNAWKRGYWSAQHDNGKHKGWYKNKQKKNHKH
jgi:hypothetical protein